MCAWQGTGFVAGIALGWLSAVPPLAADQTPSAWPVVAIGVLAHDQGFASDHHEHGVDLNLEMRFAPHDVIGQPRPQAGATLNFTGDTSIAYAGYGFTAYRISRWMLDASISIAVHDGPLHKDPDGCKRRSDCGFGTRLLPLLSAEIIYRIDDATAVSLYYDHMSHKGVIGGENEGVDHTGVRYIRAL